MLQSLCTAWLPCPQPRGFRWPQSWYSGSQPQSTSQVEPPATFDILGFLPGRMLAWEQSHSLPLPSMPAAMASSSWTLQTYLPKHAFRVLFSSPVAIVGLFPRSSKSPLACFVWRDPPESCSFQVKNTCSTYSLFLVPSDIPGSARMAWVWAEQTLLMLSPKFVFIILMN